MKVLLFSVSLFTCLNLFAGGFLWPNIDYDYAKLYMMNIPFEEPDERPEYYIYEDGIYAKSKIGKGIDLPQDFLDEFHSIMVRGMDELIYGLSKCFVPRHGIIYYDKLGNPVASVSICFECDRIEFWSANEIEQHTVDPSRFNIDRAEKQMESMKALMTKYELPYYRNPRDYETFKDSSQALKNNGEMFFDLDENDTLFNELFDKGQNWLWVHKDHRSDFEETVEMKITGGGDKIMYNQFSDKKGTRFIYLDGNRQMTEATIISNHVTLPNGVKIGMSTDEVINTFPVYDGIAWPAMIEQEFPKYTVKYFFVKQTLVKIELVSKL